MKYTRDELLQLVARKQEEVERLQQEVAEKLEKNAVLISAYKTLEALVEKEYGLSFSENSALATQLDKLEKPNSAPLEAYVLEKQAEQLEQLYDESRGRTTILRTWLLNTAQDKRKQAEAKS